MKYRRSLLKKSSKEALSLARPKAWMVALVYILIGLAITAIFSVVSPKPLSSVTEPFSASFEEVAEKAFDSLKGGASLEQVSGWLPKAFTTAAKAALKDCYVAHDVDPAASDAYLKLAMVVIPAAAILALVAWALKLISRLLNVLFDYGFRSYALAVYRRRKADFKNLLDGFRRVISITACAIVIGICSFLWTLLSTVVCGALITAVYLFIKIPVLKIILLVILGVATVVAPILILNRYALVPYLILDLRDHRALDCIDLSKEFMMGRKWRLFFLDLSFLGWGLLRVLISAVLLAAGVLLCLVCLGSSTGFGIVLLVLFTVAAIVIPIPLALWLKGYHTTARAGFYHFVASTEGILAPKEAPAEETSDEETPEEEMPAEELPTDEASDEEAPAAELSDQEVPAEEHTEEIPAEEAPMEAAPAEDAPAGNPEETPVEDLPAEDIPVEEASAEEVPAE